MSDPRRLAEQDELSRLLIGSASDDLPGAEGRAKARSAALAAAALGLGAGASVGLVTSSAKAASKAAGWVTLKWLAIASAPIAVASVSYVSLRQAEPPHPVASEAAPVSPRPAAKGAPASLMPPVAAASVAAAPVVDAPASGSEGGATPRAPAASLQAEITELDGARHALARGDGSVLDRYLTEHPRGALREQALWMKISSLEQAGRHAEAKALAKRLLSSYPNGAFSTRARALIQR